MFNISIIIRYLLIIFFIILESSFFKGLGYPWFNVNLLMSFIVFLIIKDGLAKNIVLFITGGLLFDILNGGVFGISIIALLFTCFLINLFFLYLFTNKSLFSLLVLGVIGVWFNVFFVFILSYFFYWLNIVDHNITINALFWSNLIWQTGLVLFFLLVLFFMDNMLSKKQEVRL